MDNKTFKELSENIKISLTENIKDKLKAEYEEQMKKIKSLQSIDTKNVEPMIYVDETPISFLREDTEGFVMSVEDIIDNAPSSQGNFVAIQKVVK